MVLVWMGFIMLRGNSSPTSAADNNPEPGGASLAPLILFAASPGTITGVITLSVSHAQHEVPVTALRESSANTLKVFCERRLNNGAGWPERDSL